MLMKDESRHRIISSCVAFLTVMGKELECCMSWSNRAAGTWKSYRGIWANSDSSPTHHTTETDRHSDLQISILEAFNRKTLKYTLLENKFRNTTATTAGYPHPISQCLGLSPASADQSSQQTLTWDLSLESLPALWNSPMEFQTPGFGTNQF